MSGLATAVIVTAIEAYDRLAQVAETVEDEWLYVTDLASTYRAGLAGLADPDAPEPDPLGIVAVERACEEIALIEDPHRAIDWLSTFPWVVALALGRPLVLPAPDGPAGE